MEQILAYIAASPPAEALKASRYVYPVVNAVHIMGIGALFGSILALDLRLLGAFRAVPARPLARALPRVAASGLVVAIIAGFALFSVDPFEYAKNDAFLIKLALVTTGAGHAIFVHRTPAWRKLTRGDAAVPSALRAHAALSIAIWMAAILAGRLIAY